MLPRMTESSIRVGAIDMAWEEHGQGEPPFVLVHGFTGGRVDFADHLATLASDRRVLAPDHRGHGGSTNTEDEQSYDLDILAADLAGFLDATVGAPADVLGHSMGGMVALRLALARPDLVRSLVLMDTAAESLDIPMPPSQMVALAREHGVRRLLEVGAANSPERQLLREKKGKDWIARDSEARLPNLDAAAFFALAPMVFDGENLLGRVGEIHVPTTVLVGSLDGPFVGPSERLAETIPGARLRVIEGAYHSPQHSHPEEWQQHVREHLEWAR